MYSIDFFFSGSVAFGIAASFNTEVPPFFISTSYSRNNIETERNKVTTMEFPNSCG